MRIEAVQFLGWNADLVSEWTEGNFHLIDIEDRDEDPDMFAEVYDKLHSTCVGVYEGDWIVCGIKGEYYPVNDEVFRAKYREVPQY